MHTSVLLACVELFSWVLLQVTLVLQVSKVSLMV